MTVGEIVQRLSVTGNRRYTSSQITSALGVKIGAVLDQQELDRGIRVLFDTFHVRAEVLRKTIPIAEGGGVELWVKVEELPLDLEPRFIGNVKIDDDELLEWAGLREGEELYLYQAPRIRSRLLQRYREDGFYFAEVNVVERPAGVDSETGLPFSPDVIFEIREGPKVRVKDLEVTGNVSIPDVRKFLLFKRGLKELAEVKLRSPYWFGLFPKAFDEELLQADIIAMREVYRDFGYLDAVVALERLEFSDDHSWVTPHVVVDEGGRYTVGSIRIEGLERAIGPEGPEVRPQELVFPEGDLLELIKLKVGQIYERRVLKDDERVLERRYGEQGYISHNSLNFIDRWTFLDPHLTFESEAPVVHVTYRIAQGRQIFIREIPIVGNHHTQDRVVRRLVPLKPGDVANPQEVERARQRIQSTGWFSDQFDTTHREPSFRYVDTEDPNWKDLEFSVDEGQVLQFNLAGGVSSNSGAFGQISLSIDNFDVTDLPTSFWATIPEIATRQAFHGAGQRLRISASPGTQVSSFDVLFSEPDLFRDHENRISLSVSGRKLTRGYNSHNEDREEVGFRLGRSLTVDAALFAGMRFGEVKVKSITGGDEPGFDTPLSVPRDLKDQEGTTDLAYVLLGFRYTSIDNRLSTRNGIQFNFENEIYVDALGSDEEFVKSEVSFDFWDEFDDDPDTLSSFYHVGVSGGVGFGYADSDEVPYTERFFLGGLSSLRGYSFRGVGPNANDYPRGGQTTMYGTLEYRVPLVKGLQPGSYREYETIQGGLFFDWGILGPGEFALDWDDELRASAGFLFGIAVPIPITFSFGWPILEGDGDRERVFAFNIGLR